MTPPEAGPPRRKTRGTAQTGGRKFRGALGQADGAPQDKNTWQCSKKIGPPRNETWCTPTKAKLSGVANNVVIEFEGWCCKMNLAHMIARFTNCVRMAELPRKTCNRKHRCFYMPRFLCS